MAPTYNTVRKNTENSIDKSIVNFKSLWEVRTEHLGKALPQLPQTGPDDGPVRRPRKV